MTGFGALIEAMSERGDGAVALHLPDSSVSFAALAQAADEARERLHRADVRPGDVVALISEFSRDGIAALLALAANGNIVVPISALAATQASSVLTTAQCQFITHGAGETTRYGGEGAHGLYAELRARSSPGLVLFSSGSTGTPKGAVHDFGKLLQNMPDRPLSETLVAFLLFDHIGGINTLLRALRGGATLVLPESRSPSAVAEAIERTRATILPTSPSFLAMLLASNDAADRDLSSLRVITYGTEVMPEALLKRVTAKLPHVRMKQTYGLSEIGILSTKSRSNDSTWVQLGGDGFQVRVADGLLEVKSDSAMLGYLNAPSPYTEDGWFQTFDEVEVDGDYFRILGRKSEMINVGGLKVFPQEVESALLQLDLVQDCVVYGATNPLTGQTVATEVILDASAVGGSLDAPAARSAIRRGVGALLDPHKVPTRITFAKPGELAGARFKKTRTAR